MPSHVHQADHDRVLNELASIRAERDRLREAAKEARSCIAWVECWFFEETNEPAPHSQCKEAVAILSAALTPPKGAPKEGGE